MRNGVNEKESEWDLSVNDSCMSDFGGFLRGGKGSTRPMWSELNTIHTVFTIYVCKSFLLQKYLDNCVPGYPSFVVLRVILKVYGNFINGE